MTFRALVHGCWFAHQETIWQGQSLTCMQCGTVIQVLPQGLIRGPKAQADPVRGVPTIRAKKVRRDNVTEFPERQSSR